MSCPLDPTTNSKTTNPTFHHFFDQLKVKTKKLETLSEQILQVLQVLLLFFLSKQSGSVEKFLKIRVCSLGTDFWIQ